MPQTASPVIGSTGIFLRNFTVVGTGFCGEVISTPSTSISKSLGYCSQSGSHGGIDRKSTRLNSSHLGISYAVACLKQKGATQPCIPKRSVHVRRRGTSRIGRGTARRFVPRQLFGSLDGRRVGAAACFRNDSVTVRC